eukprot:m.1148096 g.1148096  ORF g.1148096 m.1148096 type:complete len:79 (-) comp24473_c0_seq1:2240-2476(-)
MAICGCHAFVISTRFNGSLPVRTSTTLVTVVLHVQLALEHCGPWIRSYVCAAWTVQAARCGTLEGLTKHLFKTCPIPT